MALIHYSLVSRGPESPDTYQAVYEFTPSRGPDTFPRCPASDPHHTSGDAGQLHPGTRRLPRPHHRAAIGRRLRVHQAILPHVAALDDHADLDVGADGRGCDMAQLRRE